MLSELVCELLLFDGILNGCGRRKIPFVLKRRPQHFIAVPRIIDFFSVPYMGEALIMEIRALRVCLPRSAQSYEN